MALFFYSFFISFDSRRAASVSRENLAKQDLTGALQGGFDEINEYRPTGVLKACVQEFAWSSRLLFSKGQRPSRTRQTVDVLEKVVRAKHLEDGAHILSIGIVINDDATGHFTQRNFANSTESSQCFH